VDDPTDIAANDESRAERAKADKFQRLEGEGDVKWLMSSRRGRRIVWKMLERAGIYRTTFSTDPNVSAFQEGMRNAGLFLVAQIHASCPGSYVLMIEEHKIGRSDSSSSDNE